MEQQEIPRIESSESYQLKNSDETLSNATLSSNLSTSAGGSVHANNLITPDWDSHIKDLEHLLEVDLERVKIDALDASIHPTSKTGNGTLADDLLHVRQDIDRLVASIKDVEIELGKTKHKIDEEGEHVHQMNAQMEAERFLDGLHRGKLPVRVDYETGELVSRTKSIADRRQQRTRQRRKVNLTNETSSIDMINSTTRVNIQSENEEQLSLESQPSRLDEWNEFVLAGTKTGSMDEDDEFSGKKKKLALETVRQHIESHPDMKYRIQEEMEFLKSGSDPAVLSFDTHLMLDIVKLAMTASLFGLGAVFLKLPPTAGFLLGGMLIGPSCLDLLGEIHQVQTLAQFGVIFLLFEQGLLYALTYSEDASSFQSSNQVHPPHVTSQLVSRSAEEGCNITPKPSPRRETKIHSRVFSPKHHSSKGMFLPTLLTRAPSFLDATDEHDPTIVGSIILTLLVFVGLAIVFFTKVANSLLEAIMVSCTIAICSTTIVAESLLSAHISDTPWGIGVLKMVSTHDLFMVPLLALPELLASLAQSVNSDNDDALDNFAVFGVGGILCRLLLVAIFLKGSTFVANYIVRAAIIADDHLTDVKGELFTLSVVAYALLVATVSDELSMSIEAGSVLAGIALYKSPHVAKVICSIQPITSVFGGMYLTSLGMIISPTFVIREFGSIIELVCLIGFFKLTLVSLSLHRFFGYAIKPSLAVGSAMAQISEVSLLVLAKSQRMGLIRRKTYLLLIPTTCIMLTLAPLSASMLRRLPNMSSRHDHAESTPRIEGRISHFLLNLLLRLRQVCIFKKRRTHHVYSSSKNVNGIMDE